MARTRFWKIENFTFRVYFKASLRSSSPEQAASQEEALMQHRSAEVCTGLDLSIVHRIVEECGSRIELDVQEGEVAIFRVILPVSEQDTE